MPGLVESLVGYHLGPASVRHEGIFYLVAKINREERRKMHLIIVSGWRAFIVKRLSPDKLIRGGH